MPLFVCSSFYFIFLASYDFYLLNNIPYQIRYKTENNVKLEPIEEVTIEVGFLICISTGFSLLQLELLLIKILFQINEEHVGLIMEALSHRRAEVVDMGPVPGNDGRTKLSLTCPSRLVLKFSFYYQLSSPSNASTKNIFPKPYS